MKRWGFGRRHSRPMERAMRIVGYFDTPQGSPKLFVSRSPHVGHAKSLLARKGRRRTSFFARNPRRCQARFRPKLHSSMAARPLNPMHHHHEKLHIAKRIARGAHTQNSILQSEILSQIIWAGSGQTLWRRILYQSQMLCPL